MARKLTEASVGTKAAKMVESALLSQLNSLGLKLSDDEADRKTKSHVALTPAKHSRAYKRMIKGDRKKLAGIAIHMGKHLFIQEHGANTYREMHYYQVKNEMHRRRGSRIRLSKKKFISRVMRKSGAIEFISKEIGQIRAEEVVTTIIKSFSDGK